MMNDTVREELQTKITPGIAPRVEPRPTPAPERIARPPRPEMISRPVPRKAETANLATPKTSPTLVEFQNKNASLPDWRLQLQNAVQQRKGSSAGMAEVANSAISATNGGAALKAEIVGRSQVEPTPEIADPRVVSAMRRIAESRKAFLEPDITQKKTLTPRPAQARPYPFGVVSANGNGSAAAPALAKADAPPKPKLVRAPLPVEKRETNKLPPIQEIQNGGAAVAETAAEKTEIGISPVEFSPIKRIQIRAENFDVDDLETPSTNSEEIEDLAPFSMRFGAGLFDLIIGGFAGMLVLSPIAFTNGDWFTLAGLGTFAGTAALLTFLYMTVCLGFFGKTMGMRLFSLELVDAVENEYPTLRQAAVSSSIFLLSLVFGGAGFLSVFFNEEKRALHDLLSGTILVREF